jgi:plastocyanin
MNTYIKISILFFYLFSFALNAQNTANVTFQVDMSTVDPSTFTTPEVNGNFNGWCGNCASMSDFDGDNIWDVIITIDINTNYEFKFSADNWGIQESLLPGTPCTVTNFGFTNRTLNVLGDTTLSVVCWESCDDCNTGPSAYNVTFEVDMRGVTSSYTNPEVNGVFNSWCGNCWQMDDSDGDSIWQFTTVFAPGDSLEWKYSADNWNIQEDLDSSLSCIIVNYDPGAPNGYGFVNRVAVVNSDTTFSAAWNFCSSSNTINGCTDSLASNYNPLATVDDGSCLYSIIFNVDMNCDTTSFLEVNLESSSFSWCGGCIIMSDPDGDGIHSITLDLPLGNFEYKYGLDSWTYSENLVDDMQNGGSCAPITDYSSYANRLLVVSAGVSTNDTYSSCDSCIVNPIITSHTINAGNYYYNPNYLIINVGDTVTWYNDGGFHDVNGNINSQTGLSFNNPVSFSLSPISGPAFIGSYIFNVAGTYDYDCSIGNHAANGMIGAILVNSPSLSQIDLPISWDDTTVDYTVTDFGGNSSSLTVDPLDPSNNVMMSDKTSGSQTWAGTTLSTASGLLSSIPFVSGSTTISAHVYSPSAGTVVRLKAEDHTDPTRSVETEATTTVANGWNTLVFDFSNEASGTAMIDFSYNYDMLSIFYDFGNGGVGDVYYLDSVVFGGLVSGTPGCTDPTALNYDPLATIDDGSCTYGPSLSQIDLPISWDDTTVDYTVTDFGGNSSSLTVDPLDPSNNVMMSDKTSGSQTWAGTTLSTASGLLSSIPFVSGSTTISAHVYSPSAGTVVRLKAEDHTDPTRSVETEATTTVANGWNTLVFDFSNEASGTAMIDFSYNYDMLSVFYDFGNGGVGDVYYLDSVVFGGLVSGTPGCTDPLANNYDSLATFDDGSCTYCTYGCTDPLAFNFDSLATCDDGSCIAPIYGCTDSSAINFYPGANTDDGSCIYTGCTDPLANNYDPNATIDDGSCTYMNCSNPVPSGLANDWVTDTKAGINWDNMNDSSCMVWKYYVRYREVGTPTWLTKSAGVGNGLCNFGLNTTNKTLQNLTSGTTYEYKMKAFYCGGTESNYSTPSQFITATDCPPMTNLIATTFSGNQSKVTFTWDTTGVYVFARVALRVDTAGANWQTAGGFGVYYPTLSVNKFGLQFGETYRAQGRTFCDSNITSYRSWWTSPVFWTQPGSIRMSGGTMVNNLDVYPNPTNDIFNVSFVSKEMQTLSIRVLNVVGEVIHTESLEQFIGEYTKQITIGDNSKGIYFLEISNNHITTNKKIIVQ